jgi:hypothetical protein
MVTEATNIFPAGTLMADPQLASIFYKVLLLVP